MADNDVSKRYALNIEVGVDASSLESLKNIKEQLGQQVVQQTQQQTATTTQRQAKVSKNEEAINELFGIVDGATKKIEHQVTQTQAHQTTTVTDGKIISNQEEILRELRQIREKISGQNIGHIETASYAQNIAARDISNHLFTQMLSAFNQAVKEINNNK